MQKYFAILATLTSASPAFATTPGECNQSTAGQHGYIMGVVGQPGGATSMPAVGQVYRFVTCSKLNSNPIVYGWVAQ